MATKRRRRAASARGEAKLRSVLQQYRQYHVAISNERIRVDGSRATLTFERRDFDETGNAQPAFQEIYHLAKGADGSVISTP